MRAQRRLALSLLVLAGGLWVAVTGAPAHAAPAAGLTLSPSQGRSTTAITAKFRVAGGSTQFCTRFRVSFFWDQQEIGRDTPDGDCVATVKFRPPHNDRTAGPHQVTAGVGVGLAVAVFTITTTEPTGTPTAAGTPTSEATGTTATDPAIPAPTDDGTPTVAPPSLDAAGGVAAPPVNKTSSFTSTALVLGGVLVLGGIGILAFVLIRTRHGEPEPAPAYALQDFPTQQISTGFPAVPGHADQPAGPRHADRSAGPDAAE
jgi:hypothetical protein